MEQGKDEKMNKKRANFTGTIGFVMAAAGSAVGLGNIWRFPYLAAKDHGGVFILCYLILAVTFGFTLLTTEIAIGRKTGRSPLTAYAAIQPKRSEERRVGKECRSRCRHLSASCRDHAWSNGLSSYGWFHDWLRRHAHGWHRRG